MPVSDEFRCLFVHIPKTGGTSIEEALRMRGARSREDRRLLYGPIRSWTIRSRRPGTRYLQHLTIRDIRKVAPEVVDRGYFAFTFVRNPWDRIVSVFNKPDGDLVRLARKKGIEIASLTFAEFVEQTQDLSHAHLRPQCDYVLGREGRPQVDFVGRFERLQEEFDAVCDRVGANTTLAWHKRSPRRNGAHYRDYYCARTREIVAQRYARDIERFDYVF